MKGNSPLLLVVSILILQLIPISQGQVVPEVELSCDQPAPVDVYPGATRTTIIYCSLQNSNAYSVGVDLTYQQGVLSVSGPGSATVPAASDYQFQVAARADLGHPVSTNVVTVTAIVTTANGVPVSAITEPTDYEVLVVIKQFSRLRVAVEEPIVTMGIGVEKSVQFNVYNDGNDRDRFNLEIVNKDVLEGSGWSIMSHIDSIEIDSLAPPEKVRITMIAPTQLSSENFTVLSNGSNQQVFNLELKVTSDFSIRTEGVPNYQIVEISIKLIDPEDSGIGDSLAFPNSVLSVLSICSAALLFNVKKVQIQGRI
jgi:hypothetical protein